MEKSVGVFWRGEGPTWLVLIATFLCWAGLIIFHQIIPWYLLMIGGGVVAALHASLVHESVHCLRTAPGIKRVPDWLRSALFFLPVGLWFPYFTYVRSHTAHHRDAWLTDPDQDPESFYWRQQDWHGLNRVVKMIMIANQTFAGRMILGPFIVLSWLIKYELGCLLINAKGVRRTWALHVAGIALLFALVSAGAGMPWWQYVLFFAYPGLVLSLIRSF
ncbi:MAG TPA: fatty acid desaturase, partial [Rhodospirillales bacterium]|nr:fatty acid desaturase [Rhodospirillales bacterium]